MPENWRAVLRAWPGHLRQGRAPGILGLILVAAGYYGLYFRCGFNFSDEGSVALLSQRLLQGERPFVDLMLGYNVLWFYPVVALFWLFGVNVVAMKVFFFALATLSALLGYAIVEKVTGQRVYAFCVALILIALPSTSYRVYLPLLVMVNTFFLLRLIWTKSWLPIVLGGIVLGLTFLVRIDLGIFFSVLWLGTVCLRFIAPQEPGLKRWHVIPALTAIGLGVLVVHWPVYLQAKANGFEGKFVQQYTNSYRIMRDGILPGHPKPAPTNPPVLPVAALPDNLPPVVDAPAAITAPATVPATPAEPVVIAAPVVPPAPAASRTTLGRKPLEQIWQAKKLKAKMGAFVIYAPILSLGALLVWGLVAGLRQLSLRQPDAYPRVLTVLVLVGGALTLFPQFFGFRPDLSHLAEFMPGFVVATAACGYYVFQELRSRKGIARGVAVVLCSLLALHVSVWVVYAFPQRGAGSIALGRGRNVPFRAENGVDILVNAEEFAGYSAIRDTISAHSKPGEYVVCYPYSPGINVLSNRPTYEWSLYVDNAIRSRDFDARTIAKIVANNPAVIVLNDWAVNRSADSRFSVWAQPTQEYVQKHYVLAGTYLDYQIYTRP
jgi:hypothetical protein